MPVRLADPVPPGEPPPALIASAADALAWPLLLLDPDGTLLHANLAARRMLCRGESFRRLPGGRIVPAAADQRRAFSRALQRARDQHERTDWLAGSGPARIGATLTPLGAAAAQAPLLLACGAEGGPSAGADAFARLNGLTAGEARVLQRLVCGDTTRRAAQALGVSPSTVRTQVASMRRKTGHASVRALLQGLSRTPPVVPPAAAQGE